MGGSVSQACNGARGSPNIQRAGHHGLGWGSRGVFTTLAFAYFWGSPLLLKLNDEHEYMIQARLLAQRAALDGGISTGYRAVFSMRWQWHRRSCLRTMYFPVPHWRMAHFLSGWVWDSGKSWCLTAGVDRIENPVVAELFNPFRGILGVKILSMVPLESRGQRRSCCWAESPFLARKRFCSGPGFDFSSQPMMCWAIVVGRAPPVMPWLRPLDTLCFELPVSAPWSGNCAGAQATDTTARPFSATALFLMLLVGAEYGVTGR